MAIEFLQAQKRQRYLILILTLVICGILLVVWLGFFKKPAAAPIYLPVIVPPKIEINWDVLKDEALAELQSFKQIPALKDEVGRENPFTPY